MLPKKFKNSILKNYKEEILRNYDKYLLNVKALEFDLPRLELTERHIRNIKIIEDRNLLLELLPKNGVIAELGVDNGDFSFLILSKTTPKKLHLIDAWDSERYNNSKKDFVFNRFEKEISEGVVEVNIGYSIEVLKTFENNYFDWIYIDTDHTYITTKKELAIASEKVKRKGIIIGHDYYMGNWVAGYKYGVIEAVHEFCVLNNWELIYLTIEQSIPPSFAIRKL